MFIVSCHILQGYDNVLAWWLNVGVQIFLVMSGFLFGAKNISSISRWYGKRFKRIFKTYYIFLIIVIIVYFVFRRDVISYKLIIVYLFNLQGILGTIPGIEHLWYITLIAICYLITPLIYKYNIAKSVTGEIEFYIIMFVQFLVIQMILLKTLSSFAPWIATYMFGFYIAGRYDYKIPIRLKYLMIIAIIILVPLKIYFQYFFAYNEISHVTALMRLAFSWVHALLGCTIFVVLFNLFPKLKELQGKKYFAKAVHTIDDYSYEVYITHHIFILGTFSILKITPYSALNILIIIVLIGLSAFVLKKLFSIEFKQITLQRKENM